MNIFRKLVRYVVKLDAWVNQASCTHLYTKWTGQGIAFDDHGIGVGVVRYKCLKCGKRFEKKRTGVRDAKSVRRERKEMAFREGGDAYKLRIRDTFGRVKTVADNPYTKESDEYEAWKRGFQLEAWRARDSK